ncbi:MAG: hypothetical protein ACLQCU_01970 [Acidimicrobiales bacterium]
MRRPLLMVTLTAVIAFTAGCGNSSAGSKGPNGVQSKSADQIMAAAVAATKRQSSFHFVETASQGSDEVSVVGDIGTSSGEQHVTMHEGTRTGHLTLLLAGGTAYVQGDVAGLESFTGLSAKLSAKFSGDWISVPSTNQGFASIAGSLAVKTAAAQFVKLPGKLTRGKTSTELGHPAVAVKAAQSSKTGTLSLTMYVATTGAVLPIMVEGTTRASGSAARSLTARFSDWGEALRLTAPNGAVPIADVQAAAG